MAKNPSTRERLISSALELMYEQGFEACGVAEICAAAEVNKGSFYHFFPSKQQLTIAAIEEMWARTQPDYEALSDSSVDPLKRLEGYLDGHRRSFRQCKKQRGQVHGCFFGNLALELSAKCSEMSGAVDEVLSAQRKHIEVLMSDLREAGRLKSERSDGELARDLQVFLQGSALLAKAENRAPSPSNIAGVHALLGVRADG